MFDFLKLIEETPRNLKAVKGDEETTKDLGGLIGWWRLFCF